MRPARGFTLLEAIVSLVLLATTGLALLAWVNNHANNLGRLDAVLTREAARENALAWGSLLNPMQQPQGEHQLGEYRFTWTSTPLQPPRDGRTTDGGLGNFQVGLYRVLVEVHHGSNSLASVTLRQPGYRQVRFPDVINTLDELP